MFTIIKSIGTKTIAIVVCVVITMLLATTYFLYNSNNNKATENGVLKTENVTMRQNEVFTEKSAKITDTVVSDYVEKSVKANTSSEKLRKESLNEYAKKVEMASDGSSEQDSRRAGDERVAKLARSLHANYCRIRPEDADCRTIDTDSGLRDKQTTK